MKSKSAETEEVEGDDSLPALLLSGDQRFVRIRRKPSTSGRPPLSGLRLSRFSSGERMENGGFRVLSSNSMASSLVGPFARPPQELRVVICFYLAANCARDVRVGHQLDVRPKFLLAIV